MLRDDLHLIQERIQKAETIAIFTHVRPDGDSIGSVLALGWTLQDMGKTVEFVSEDPIPDQFDFLFQYCPDQKNPFIPEPVHADCCIVPDISSLDRAGKYFFIHADKRPDICIDHHISNKGIGKLNWIEGDSPATCCVLEGILPKLGGKFTPRISSALLCGIITDTNSFSTSNVTSESLRAAADLVDNGAPIFDICHQAYKEHTMEEMALWRLGMNNIQIEGSLIWSQFRKEEREAIGYFRDEDPGFVSYMGNTRNMEVSVLFIEIDDHQTKISWRAQPGFNVANVAVALGGGGHEAAAGATVKLGIDAAIPLVLNKTKELLF